VSDRAATEMGRRGGLKGGRARAEKLTPAQRSESARAAALARWRKPTSYEMPNGALATLRVAIKSIEEEIAQLQLERAALRRILREQER
jgi:hypothetical protein